MTDTWVSGEIFITSADLGGPPTAQNVLNFMQFFHKFMQNHMLAPPGGLAPPPTGNPGSAPDYKCKI